MKPARFTDDVNKVLVYISAEYGSFEFIVDILDVFEPIILLNVTFVVDILERLDPEL